MVIDVLLEQVTVEKEERCSNYVLYHARTADDVNVILSKPLTFMNRSGCAVEELVSRFGIPLSNLLIILDDLNLPLGKLRLRPDGSDGGHNGLKSIIAHLQDDKFPRCRIGIGQDTVVDTVDFVLGEFDENENDVVTKVVSKAVDACSFFVTHEMVQTMNLFN